MPADLKLGYTGKMRFVSKVVSHTSLSLDIFQGIFWFC